MLTLHQRAKEIFLASLDQPSAERAAYIADACAGDVALRTEVESLLEFHEEAAASVVPQLAVTAGTPVGDTPSGSFAPGDVFASRYRMIAPLGRGGMGVVWRADDLVLQTPVALKLIDASSRDARERILNEVRLSRQITHPAVCRVFDVGEAADGAVFYTMELVQGEDLAALLRR